MAFSFTWNAAFKAAPADSEAANLGASRIRDFKAAVTERLEVDHSLAGDAHDGKHNKATLREQAADPTTVASAGLIYTKASGGLTELFYRDAAGTVLQLTRAGKVNDFPSGTRMLFHQTAAPTGWTKDTTAALNDSILRIVTGAVGSGGTNGFAAVFNIQAATASHTLTIAEMPAHTHTYRNGAGAAYGQPAGGIPSANDGTTDSTGGGGGHTHGITTDIKYNDVIIASKD